MKNIYVSRTRLPTLERYNHYLKKIWKSNWLTNNGELVQELERKLAKRFGVKNVVCVSSGSMALMIALKAMDIKEINTTPFSFIATISIPVWMSIRVNFYDEGEPIPCNFPALFTHTYGTPCLMYIKPIIYDASHAFATKVDGKSILTYGDCSIISFHAVKIFQTIEGGAVVTNNDSIAKKARWMRNYGFKTQYSFQGVGINGKMNEFEAAMGLCSLETVDDTIKIYHKLIKYYDDNLGLEHSLDSTYYPIWLKSERSVLRAIKKFEEYGIYPRRYFYPPLSKVFHSPACPSYEDLMSRVLCLPLYYSLTEKEQDKIIKIAKEFI
jgi:dTDP-4-amino-4,6-dideoxygalactose transaminase